MLPRYCTVSRPISRAATTSTLPNHTFGSSPCASACVRNRDPRRSCVGPRYREQALSTRVIGASLKYRSTMNRRYFDAGLDVSIGTDIDAGDRDGRTRGGRRLDLHYPDGPDVTSAALIDGRLLVGLGGDEQPRHAIPIAVAPEQRHGLPELLELRVGGRVRHPLRLLEILLIDDVVGERSFGWAATNLFTASRSCGVFRRSAHPNRPSARSAAGWTRIWSKIRPRIGEVFEHDRGRNEPGVHHFEDVFRLRIRSGASTIVTGRFPAARSDAFRSWRCS